MAAIEWFRLWHDMPNDPKWRTIARVSGQPISVVISVALHVMVDASRNVTRGHVDVTAEDIASGLDVTDEAVEAVLSAMQGRILDGDRLTGWEKRQPKREDTGNQKTGAMSATERKRLQRARERLAKETAEEGGKNECHEESRKVTTDTDKDTDTEYKEKTNKKENSTGSDPADSPCVVSDFSDFAESPPEPAENPQPDNPVSTAGAIATYCRSQGIDGSPGPRLKQLVEQGAEMSHFVDAIPIAKQAGKGFSYLLGIVKNMLTDPPKARASPAKPSVSSKFDPVAYVNQGRIQHDPSIIDI